MTHVNEGWIYQTERLTLRGLRREDLAGGYPRWFDDQDVCKYNAHGVFPVSLKEMETFVDSLASDRSRIVWAMVEREGGRHIGNISLQDIDPINRSADLAIIVGEKDCWGKGFALEAARTLCRHGFNKLDLRRISCGTAAPNVAMQKLAKALGMSLEGTRRQALYLQGAYVDVHEFGMLRDEFISG